MPLRATKLAVLLNQSHASAYTIISEAVNTMTETISKCYH